MRFKDELQFSVYNFEMADVHTLWKLFDLHEKECQRLLQDYTGRSVPLPAYDQVLKCSNLFNPLDSRGAISVTERVGVIRRVRKLAVGVAEAWMAQANLATGRRGGRVSLCPSCSKSAPKRFPIG